MLPNKMASLEPFVRRIKPAMDAFLRSHTKENLAKLDYELTNFNWLELRIFHDQILLPLVLKMEEIDQRDEEVRTGTLKCIRVVTSHLYVSNVNALRTIVIMALKQLRDCNAASIRANASEELKLATIECIFEVFRRSTTDVLEKFYVKEKNEMMLGQVMLTLAELIEKEQYRKLTIASIQCLMAVFYVHDEADRIDVVLRSQVANSLFMFMPKIVTILFTTTLAEEKLGETLKAMAIKALGRILWIIFEETNEAFMGAKYNVDEFKALVDGYTCDQESACDVGYESDTEKNKESLEKKLERLKVGGRSPKWFAKASAHLHPMFLKTKILRSHASARIRQEYAQMCCALLTNCAHNLKHSCMCLLENVVAMSEDADDGISRQCKKTLERLQDGHGAVSLFDESAETLFDEHLVKLPRIINRCDESEQYAELLFIKAFLLNLSAPKMEVLLLLPNNLEMFCTCLLAAVDLKVSRQLLIEEISLRELNEDDYVECAKLRWRDFDHLSSSRCIQCIKEICEILGRAPALKRITFDFLLENLTEQNEQMNGLILLMLWMATACTDKRADKLELVNILLEELLNDKHWRLALQPDEVVRLKVDKPTNWFVDRTPGLFESAIEIRTQDYDSDDEHEPGLERKDQVTIAAAQFNILHTCIVLDALGHCALFYGDTFDKYLFRCLHKILLKVASSNTMVYQAANFALVAIQKALRFAKMTHFIEAYTDSITFYLNAILKRSPESSAAVDILTVVLQLSTSNALPHLDSIFQTMRNECTKECQSQNINSYLKVYNAFLTQVGRWQLHSTSEVNNVPMQVDAVQDTDLLSSWLAAVEAPQANADDCNFEMQNDTQEMPTEREAAQKDAENTYTKPALPHHIGMIKDILQQVVKFISSKESAHQILALECIITGLPLLADYEDDLLPLVHTLWQPLVEKFRQKDAIVLNRCFTLLNTLATHAKEFILKRSLDQVIPFLKQFLQETSKRSAAEKNKVPTQEYKLQLKLLQEFPNLIQSMQIDGKHLNEITDSIALYLSDAQPEELQSYAAQFFILLKAYDGPMAYLAVVKRVHLKEYKKTATQIFNVFGVLC